MDGLDAVAAPEEAIFAVDFPAIVLDLLPDEKSDLGWSVWSWVGEASPVPADLVSEGDGRAVSRGGTDAPVAIVPD